MAIQQQGFGGVIAEVDGVTFRAQRITPRPIEYGAYGHYRFARTVPLLASQAANGTLFSFRWADTTRFAVISKIKLSVIQTAMATATIMPIFEVLVARAWSASDSGGTALVLTGNSFKKRTTMGTTLLTDARASSATTGLTVGTRTLDGDAILQLPTQQTITTPNAILYVAELDISAGDGNHPLVLAQNEGFIVRGPTVAFGVAGTANLMIETSWAEVAAY